MTPESTQTFTPDTLLEDSLPTGAANATETQVEQSTTLYPCRIPVRMTYAERATIGKKSCALNLSISRFLVESAVQNKAGGSDPDRLRYLQVLFQDAADKAKLLLASPLFTPKNELTNEVRNRLEEAAYLLKALAGELARRLPER